MQASSRVKILGRDSDWEQTVFMAKSGKSIRQAAAQVAEIMAASLSQFSQAEQNKRLKAIHKIALSTTCRPVPRPVPT
jgi:hypothetical protein